VNLFIKPIDKIEFNDVVNFCIQGIKENIYLDYKKDFPKKLEKTISSFANTFGGMIIIGIDEDNNSKPKPPFEGIDFEPKLEDKITNIIIDNINPPIFPEIQIVPEINNKTFVIIIVEQSEETPHRIDNDKNAYIRTGNISNPIDLATGKQLKWLENRRKKSIEFREYLKKRSEYRKDNLNEHTFERFNKIEFSLSFCPLYPNRQLIEKEKIGKKFQNVLIEKTSKEQFPFVSGQTFKPVQNGLYRNFNSNYNYIYTEFNTFGLFYHCQSLESVGNNRVLKLELIFRIIQNSFDIIRNFYDNIGYFGFVEVSISIRKLKGCQIIPLNEDVDFLEFDESHFNLEDKLNWLINFNQVKMRDNTLFYKTLRDLFSDISWSFGFGIEKYNEIIP